MQDEMVKKILSEAQKKAVGGMKKQVGKKVAKKAVKKAVKKKMGKKY